MAQEPNEKHSSDVVIPVSVVKKIRRSIARSGEPRLHNKLRRGSQVVEAWESDEGYNLTLPEGEWEPPFYTYREYAEYRGVSPDDIMAEHGFEDESQLDEVLEDHEIEDLVDSADAPMAAAWEFFSDLPDCYVDYGDRREKLDLVSLMDGGGPGNSYQSAYVDSAENLSLLQYVLDQIGSDIRIVLQ